MNITAFDLKTLAKQATKWQKPSPKPSPKLSPAISTAISGITWEALPIVECILLQRLSEIATTHRSAKLLSERTAEVLLIDDMIVRHGLAIGIVTDVSPIDYLSEKEWALDADALLTGQRREQAHRAALPFEQDDKHRGIKIYHPLADWSPELVWAYIQAHKVPYSHLEESITIVR